jgi:hypothetical protein
MATFHKIRYSRDYEDPSDIRHHTDEEELVSESVVDHIPRHGERRGRVGSPARRRASNELQWECNEPAAVKLLDGLAVEIAGRVREVSGTKVRIFLEPLDRPLPTDAAVSVILESRQWLAEVLACFESEEGRELWLEVRHVLPSAPAAVARGAGEGAPQGVQAGSVRDWAEVSHRLAKALRGQTMGIWVKGDREFDKAMRSLAAKLWEISGPAEALQVAETAIMTAEQHNQQAAESVRRQLAETDQLLQRVLAILGALVQQSPTPDIASRIGTLIDSIHRIRGLGCGVSPPEAERAVVH